MVKHFSYEAKVLLILSLAAVGLFAADLWLEAKSRVELKVVTVSAEAIAP